MRNRAIYLFVRLAGANSRAESAAGRGAGKIGVSYFCPC
jgi:hypothetical protein